MILGLLLSSCLKNSVETVILSVCESTRVCFGTSEKRNCKVFLKLFNDCSSLPTPSFHVLFASHQFLLIKDRHRTGVMRCVTNQNELGKNASNGHTAKKINVWIAERRATCVAPRHPGLSRARLCCCPNGPEEAGDDYSPSHSLAM